MREPLIDLRQEMAKQGLDAFFISTADFHQSEYVSDYFKVRQFVSGFSGSAGNLLVTKEFAGLWTDGRYFLQAEEELKDSGITLQKMGEPGVEKITDFLSNHLSQGARLGLDGRTISSSLGKDLQKAMDKIGGTLVLKEEIADIIWTSRPPLTSHPLFLLEEKYTGKSACQKIREIREQMEEKGCTLHLLSSLDDIAWILNLRGADIPYNPVFFSHLALTPSEAFLYVFEDALTPSIVSYLRELGMEIRPYFDFFPDLSFHVRGKKVWVDPQRISYALQCELNSAREIFFSCNPTTLAKAIKNEAEIASLRIAHQKDGAAMVNFLYWLKNNIGQIPMTELSASDYLAQCRHNQENCLDLSFATIAGYGPHGAIVHYTATPKSNATLEPHGLFLVDSGGQYLEGTTDITRTIALGPLTRPMKEHFTYVLRSMIDLAIAKFPEGCTGSCLDILARHPLWEYGLDYNHGTGHGVGFLLYVHEGPNSFRWKVTGQKPACVFEPGMVTTDEPGYYATGSHGIRTENVLLCLPWKETEHGRFFQFEMLTLCPIDTDAIIPELLTDSELTYLNNYHEEVYQKLKSLLSPEVAQWLFSVTRPLLRNIS